MIYAVTGPDSYLVRAAVRSITAAHDPQGLNTSIIDAKPTNLEEIIAALGTPGFFGSTRIVIVNDLVTLATKGASGDDGDGEEKPTRGSIDWPRLFGTVRPENIAVFVDRGLQTVPAALKRVLPADAKIVIGDPKRGSELISWIKGRAKEAGSTINDAEARHLAELLCPTTWGAKPTNPAYDRPPDLDLFAGEIEKLALSAFPGGIERGHIETMTATGRADRLFPLIDAVIAGDAAAAIRELGASGPDTDEAARTAAQLNQQAELLAVMAVAGSTDPVEIGRAIGLANPNRMIAVGKSMRRYRGGAKPLLAAALETERELKTGVLRQPADAVYALIERALSLGRETREGGR